MLSMNSNLPSPFIPKHRDSAASSPIQFHKFIEFPIMVLPHCDIEKSFINNPHKHTALEKTLGGTSSGKKHVLQHTSRAETNCRGRREAFKSLVLLSRSKRALAREDSNSEGLCLEGELAAILLREAMIVRTEFFLFFVCFFLWDCREVKRRFVVVRSVGRSAEKD